MSTSIRVPNYYDGVTPLYLSTWASDYSSARQDTLHQSMYIRIDDDDATQLIWGEDSLTTVDFTGWYNFPVIAYPDDGELEIKGAKIPVTITIKDDLGDEVEYEMGPSQTSVTLTPALDRSFVSAKVIKRV